MTLVDLDVCFVVMRDATLGEGQCAAFPRKKVRVGLEPLKMFSRTNYELQSMLFQPNIDDQFIYTISVTNVERIEKGS